MTAASAGSEVRLCRPVTLARRLLWVDGPARSGKTTLCRMVGSLADCEIERIEEIVDYVGFLYSFGKISHDAAVALLRMFPDIFLYNSLLARNINFRWGDASSGLRSAKPFLYLRRLFRGEHQEALAREGADRAIFQNHTHFQLERIGIHFDAHPEGLSVIEVLRHPADLVHAWWIKGRGGDLCSSPWNVAMCGTVDGQCVHHLAFGWEAEYAAMAPADRIVRMLHGAQMRARQAYRALPGERRRKVMVVKFEDLAGDPHGIIAAVAQFIGSRPTRATRRTISKMGLPWLEASSAHERNLAELAPQLGNESRRRLDEMIADYRTGWDGGA